MKNKLTYCVLGFLFHINVNAQVVNIPDSVFLDKLIEDGVDLNNDGVIQVSEAEAVTDLNVSSLISDPNKILDLEGIQSFTNLLELMCFGNLLTSLDVTGLSSLQSLLCQNNQLSVLQIDGLTELERVWAYSNELSSIDLSNLPNVWFIWFNDNSIEEIDLGDLTNLEVIRISDNQLTSIDFTLTPNLTEISVSENALTELEVDQLSELQTLFAHTNLIEEIDLVGLDNLSRVNISNNLLEVIDGSQNPNFIDLYCDSNPNLVYINMKNGIISTSETGSLPSYSFAFNNLTSLAFVCIDEGEENALAESGINIDEITVSTNTCTFSIVEVDAQDFSIYPNPTANFLHIESNSTAIQNIEIFNSNGKRVLQTNIVNNEAIEVVDLDAGLYLLKIQTESGSFTKKFVKE